MPARGSRTRPPRSFVVSGEWPDGEIDGPTEAAYAQHVARRLVAVLAEKGISRRAAATLAGLDRETITRLVEGQTVPDIASVAALEDGLDVDLWPSRRDLAIGHRKAKGDS